MKKLLPVIILGSAQFVCAADKTWVGSSGGGDGTHWSDPNNWNPAAVPTSSDTICFTSAAMVENNIVSLTVAGISSSSGAVTISGNGLTVGSKGIVNKANASLTFDVPIVAEYATAYQHGGAWGYKTIFKKGLTRNGTWYTGRPGFLVFQDAPISVSGTFYQEAYDSTVYFSVSSNRIGTLRTYWHANTYLQAMDALIGKLSVGNGGSADGQGTTDLGGFDQWGISTFTSACPESHKYFPKIASTDRATMYLSGAAQGSPECVAQFTGKAGLCWNPDDAGTLTFKYVSHPTAGWLVVSNGTVKVSDGATFTALSKLAVAKEATLEVESGSGDGFVADSLEIHQEGLLKLGAGVLIRTKSAKLFKADGSIEHLEGDVTYTKDTCGFIEGEGSVYVEMPSSPTSTETWDAGGVNDNLRTAANWQGDVVPDLTSGGVKAVFAAGTSATVDAPTRLNGLEVTAASGDFTFNGSESLKVFAGGVSLSAGSSARELAIGAPLVIGQTQTWKLNGANDVLTVRGGLSGLDTATLTVSGGMRLGFENCVSTFKGRIVSPLTGRVFLKNVDIAGPLTLSNGSVTLNDYSSDADIPPAWNRSSIIRGEMWFRGVNNIGFRGRLILAGGVRQDAGIYVKSTGTIVITNQPNATTSAKTWSADDASTTELWAPGNSLNLVLYNGAKAHCKVGNALNGTGSLRMGVGALDIDRRGWLYLVGDQAVTTMQSFVSRQGGQEIDGEKYSVLTTADPSDSVHYVVFKRGASYRQTGSGSTVFYKASSSTGTVEVVAGTLTFGCATNGTYHCSVGQRDYDITSEGGSWTNAVRLTVGGGASVAKVRILHAKTFGRQTAVEIVQNGELYLADGVVENVHSLSIDGHPVSGGTWGSPTSSAFNKSTKFTGSGVLKVRGGGMMLIFR